MGTEGKVEKKDLFCPYCDEAEAEADSRYCRAVQIHVIN